MISQLKKIGCSIMFLLLVAPAFGKTIKSNFINLNNRVRIHYYDNNNGSKVILFVHGLPLNADSWRPQLENFQKKYRVIALDLPGYGLSTSLPTPIPAELSAWYANVISHFLKKLGVKNVVFIGFASAGHIGMKFSATYPDQVDKLIVINSSPQFNQGPDWPYGFTSGKNKSIVEKIIHNDFKNTIESIINVATQEKCNCGLDELRARFYKMGMMSSKKTLLGFFNHIAHENFRPLLKKIHVPTLIITSNLGLEVPQEVGLYLRRNIPDSQLVEINGADHFVFATSANYVNQVIERFLTPICTFEAGQSIPRSECLT